MPVSPWHTLALHIHASLLPTVLVALSLPCISAGAGLSWWAPVSIIRWIVFALAFLWCWFLNLALIMTVSRHPKGLQRLQGFLLAWSVISIIRICILWGESQGSILQVSDLILADWGLRSLGITGFVRTMTAPNNSLLRIGLCTLGHLGLNAALLIAYTWRQMQRRPLERQDPSLALRLSRPVKHALRRLLPGALGGQVCLESLRMLRSTNEMLIVYTLIILGTVVIDRLSGNQGELGAMALVFGSMALATDTAGYILDRQRGKLLYDVYGTDTRHYLLGFTGSLGVIIALLCAIQIPLLGPLDWRSVLTVFSACTASSIMLTDFGLVTNRHFKRIGNLTKLIEASVCGAVILVATILIWSLSLIHFSLPLLLAAAVLHLRARHTDRAVVKKLYWDMSW